MPPSHSTRLPGRTIGPLGRLLFVLAATSGLLPSVGCGTSCREIASHRLAFAQARARTEAPHASLVLPFAVANGLLSAHLAARVSDRLVIAPLEPLGADLGVSFALTGARLSPGERDDGEHVGVEIEVAVRDGALELFSLGLRADLRPRFDPVARTVALMLRPEAVREVRPKLGPEGRARVGRWLQAALPEGIGEAMGQAAAAELGAAVVGWLAESGFPLVRDHLLADLEETPLAAVELPELPIASATFRVLRGRTPALAVDVVTTLPVEVGLAADADVPPADALGVRLSGETAAELANLAMAHGKVPSRFDRSGKPSATGPFEARLGWEGGPRPLKIHLWRTTGDCTYALLGATPRPSFDGERLRLAVTDGAYEVVRGPGLTEAFAWTEMLWGDPVTLAVELARAVELEFAGARVALRVGAVEVGPRELRLLLKVGAPASRGPEGERVGAEQADEDRRDRGQESGHATADAAR